MTIRPYAHIYIESEDFHAVNLVHAVRGMGRYTYCGERIYWTTADATKNPVTCIGCIAEMGADE